MRIKRLLFALALAACASPLAACGPEEPQTPGPRTAAESAPTADPEAGLERVLKPLPDSGFKAQVTVVSPPAKLGRGERADVTVRVRNTSNAEWPVRGRAGDGIFQVNLGDRWLAADGKTDVRADERVFLPRAVKPGEEVEITLVVVAPGAPGDYTVEVDMVQEGVAWFFQKGSQPARFKIKVE